MDSPLPQKRGFPFVQTVVAGVILLILAALLLPCISSGPHPGSKLTSALSNGRQIHQSAYRMVLDNAAEPNPEFGWPGDLALSTTKPISTLGQYVERLVEHKYLDRSSLAKLFAGPTVPAYSGTGPFEGKNSVYHIYKVTAEDSDAAIFLATKNFNFGGDLDVNKPYGDKGAVIVRKGGDAQRLTAGQAMNRNIGLMPGGTPENPGEQEGNVLKD